MSTTKIVVQGMTCGNCARHVTEALEELGGVTKVDVELDGGYVTIESSDVLDAAAVSAAVEEAGYAVVG